MKRRIQYIAFTIFILVLASMAWSSPLNLEYKFKSGDQLTWKINIDIKSSIVGSPGETLVSLETTLTQIVEKIYEGGNFDLLGAANIKVIQASTGGRDITNEMDKSEDMSIVRQKMAKDGRILESSGMIRFILPLGFRNQFRPLGALPDKPVELGEKWTKPLQDNMENLPVNYTLSGFETRNGYNCAKIIGETNGVLQDALRLGSGNVDLMIEKAENVTYFAVIEGFDVQHETNLKLKTDPASGFQLNIEMNFKADLANKKKLTSEDLDKVIRSLALLETGLDDLNKRNFSGAEDIFLDFLSTYKDSPWYENVEKLLAGIKAPSVDRMSQLAQQGKLNELLVLVLEAMEKGTTNQKQMGQGLLLNAYRQSNRLHELIPVFENFLKDNPDNPEGSKMLGMIYLSQNDEDKALEFFEKSAQLNSDDFDVQSSLGFLYSTKGKYDDSINSYRKSLRLNPDAHYLYPEIAGDYMKMDKPDEAGKIADDYKQIMQDNLKNVGSPDNEAIMQSILADIYTVIGRYDEAIDLYNKSIELDPRRESYYKQHLAETYTRAGKPELAEELRESMLPPVSKFVGKPAPPFKLRDINGIEVELEEFKGKMVILNFWATWCPYCVREIPHFIELYTEYKDKGLAIIGISTDRQGIDVVKSYVQKHNINYTILMANLNVQRDYGGVQSIPVTFIIDKEGKVVKQYNGYKSKDVFLQDIREILGDNPESSEPKGTKPITNPASMEESLKLDEYEIIEVATDERDLTLISQASPSILSGKGNKIAPGFVLMDLSDKAVQLSNLKGKVVLLVFWATWCESCQKSTSFLESLYKKYKDKGLVIIGMNNEKDIERVKSFIKGRISYITIPNAEKQFSDYSVVAIPSLFYIDKKGKLRYFDIGYGSNMEKEIEQKVLELMGEK